ncbi:DEAD/DEAH box helicase [Fluviicola sp.]|jgi:ATP-dependent RNA helicase DeaD|uniref:DEAD/DEAH box helicase n=1 Tax=Fluviicola sp. TaxID=1917219 RepID=UPI0028390F24|nr:DEAD/DEAH box helicase [Fluviicola sp.]MDR0803311.1 DEAD/DEAH box helicase [Fluviicola sp.]
MTFKELGLRVEVLQSIEAMGFAEPTPIQQSAIPHLLQLDSDFVGLAQTGTGKTAAFGLPLIHKVTDRPTETQGLVIAPTRELCLQISKDLEAFAQFDRQIKVVAVYGGTDIRRQISDIKRGATIVVATPGRLVDLINRRAINLQTVETVVLDEADEMLNMGFKEDIDEILDATPDTKNVWLFSATMPKEVAEIAKNYMSDPLEVTVGHKNQSNENIEHIYYSVKEKDRYDALKRLIDASPEIFGLVFCRTRNETATVAEKLMKDGYSAEPLHGDLSQAMRDRVMERFRERSIQLLVATDVAARGIDVDNITHVINYNLPDDIENYTHRSGRTARAGRQGKSLVLINTRESYKIKAIERQIRMNFTPALIPSAQEICGIQLNKLIAKVKDTEVKEKDIEPFLEGMMADFADLSKEEIIKKFVSAEFNRFIEYYDRAGDLNVTSGRGERGERSDRKERGDRFDRKDRFERSERGDRGSRDANRTRFFVSLGKRDGLNPGGLLRVICDSTGLKSASVGRIDVMPNFSFFEADKSDEAAILSKVNGADYEGHRVSVEITQKKDGGSDRGRGGDRERKGGFSGGGKSGGFGGDRKFSGSRDGGRSDRKGGGFSGSKSSGRREGGKDRAFGNRRFSDKSSSTIKNY